MTKGTGTGTIMALALIFNRITQTTLLNVTYIIDEPAAVLVEFLLRTICSQWDTTGGTRAAGLITDGQTRLKIVSGNPRAFWCDLIS